MNSVNNNKRKTEESLAVSSKKIRRITPIKISSTDAISTAKANGAFSSNVSLELLVPLDANQSSSKSGENTGKTIEVKPNINPAFQGLLDACRKAEKSEDMERLIDKKLIKYYENVHPDFINSKSFCKSVKLVTEEILKNPQFVYLKLKNIVEELNARRKSKVAVVTNEEVSVNGTGNEKLDLRIEKLNKALSILNRKIQRYEQEEVDFVENDEAHSAYLISEKCKKRACEVSDKNNY